MSAPTALPLWIATANQGKLNEFKMLLNRLALDIHSTNDLPVFSAPPETGETFLDNARIKTRALKAVNPCVWVMGEDSGLEVDGLKGLPGVHSARYAGPKAADSENNAKLLKMMAIRQITDRKAQFRAVLVAFSPDGTEHIFEGILRGTIAKYAAGGSGFGYDPVFIPEGQTKTLAELGLAYKNQVSHRAAAVAKLAAVLETQSPTAAK